MRLPPDHVGNRLRWQMSRVVFTRLALKIVILLLFAMALRPQNYLGTIQMLFLLSATFSALLAVFWKDRWDRRVMTRWDEAAIFLTICLGVRTFS